MADYEQVTKDQNYGKQGRQVRGNYYERNTRGANYGFF
jgi:hypothetical protein